MSGFQAMQTWVFEWFVLRGLSLPPNLYSRVN